MALGAPCRCVKPFAPWIYSVPAPFKKDFLIGCIVGKNHGTAMDEK
jgi:hypothetical protein